MENLLKLKEQLDIIHVQLKEIADNLLRLYDDFKSNPTMTGSDLKIQMTKVAGYQLTTDLVEKERIKIGTELLSAIESKQLELEKRDEQLECARHVARGKYNTDGNKAQLEATLLTLKDEQARIRSERKEFLIFLKEFAQSEKDNRDSESLTLQAMREVVGKH